MFESQLTPRELTLILSEESEEGRYDLFFLYWAMKEVFVKAIGQGLGYSLQNIEFEILPTSQITGTNSHRKIWKGQAKMSMSGERRDDWQFHYVALDDRHILAIGLGPCKEALLSYQEVAWDSERESNNNVNSMHGLNEDIDLKTVIEFVDTQSLCMKAYGICI
jgi:4'-phosphopantetheinyl transferase